MENIMIMMPLNKFVEGENAIKDLNHIRELIGSGRAYCSDDIKAIIGAPIKQEKD